MNSSIRPSSTFVSDMGQDENESPQRPDISTGSGTEKISDGFYYDRSASSLYTASGYLVSENVDWVKPALGDHLRVVYEVNSMLRGGVFETILNDDFEITVTHRVKNRNFKDLSNPKDRNTECIWLPTIPEYKALKRREKKAECSDRPYWVLSKSEWTWEEVIEKGERKECEHCDLSLNTKIRVYAEKGRVLAGRPLLESQVVNEYCLNCVIAPVKPQDELDYISPVEFRDEHLPQDTEGHPSELEDNRKQDAGYRLIVEDVNSNHYYCVISVSPVEENEFFVTVELVDGGVCGQLMERETPTIKKENAEEAAKRAKELYESFWSSDKYGELEFETVESKVLD